MNLRHSEGGPAQAPHTSFSDREDRHLNSTPRACERNRRVAHWVSDDVLTHLDEIRLRQQAVAGTTDAWAVAGLELAISMHERAIGVAVATLAGAS